MQRWKIIAAVGAVAAVVITSIVVLLITSTGPSAAPEPTATTGPGPRIAPPEPAPASSPTPMVENRPSGPDQTNQVKVCNAYLDAFLIPGSEDERAARLRDWGTPQNVEQARLTDARRLTSARRKGDCALDDSNAGANQVQLHVQTTDGAWWAATLVKDLTVPSQWRVHVMTREGH